MGNPVLGRELIEDLAAFNRKLRAVFDKIVRERNMTLPRARVFFTLNKKDGINQRELAERLELETPTLVRILDAMEGQGFVQRRVAGSDRRAKEIYITETGKVVAGEIDDIAVKVRAQVIAGIPENDLKTTLEVIRAMQANLQGIRGI
ncbi:MULTISPECIES: MarR family transcriptional regulator [Rhizobium]|jgi:MarR family transcriptional regulator for hemolysin|uniref:MarR family transcriptional regulator, transcriptional regulator for hemolysin n=1 Tax=Rhizobium tibeticum TaxID=501024 RepID=A0A1H8GD24_9HYPH|nr:MULTISPECIES: MarR family transcriptional regulator [Rhizobium]EJL50270.1 transcriptional regulator [Rhizobium sp. CF122]MBB3398245.1 MarR family transcriptional regulator for hemolysin [Rhizobium sp. BK060]MBB4168549.1 MarR family transcriptional regulator for hemolysin [Rhizobium sp. BK538]MBZ9791808.1 MarR family transcriptional regulator [Rhizobium sp. 3T7]MDP9808656.1 MarR family transcriptional regulator for hemolysin [Rhizobium tibeticum]